MTNAEPSYEEARDELVQIVAKLEAGGATLEESLALWQRGEELAALCERYLDGARRRLDAAQAGESAEPTDADAADESAQPSRPAKSSRTS